ncbi:MULTISPECIES: DUF58 domain-containing protein [Cellulophaga]|uniref:DUF58 domain-containing protein n=2 Tax=Cellulophaga TaxID=104264 RepID=F0RD03_CELLC|nr:MULTISPECIES: DUF58 domain-containing protein [Cellulophaga]ADY28690.1 protein of unknown function DUF58 [Cellulophaga lytica DSM 7489]EWH13046.1 hypothetical protein KLA_11955 [Cellulophaga geojensis KL-A]MDO6853991.1 DUF58 domain-containing protein [Cellulophaga lytica]WQG77131.1 DUF58 domain-containing protein [Cellulophaga lytica]
MNLKDNLNAQPLLNLELLAKQVVEGFISGIHKSPFHGFSAEFAEHKIYNKGESTKHIDWKLFAKTDKLYTKRYEEETNLRCHMILDNSASMYYPETKKLDVNNLNKIGFGVLAIAGLMNILKKQRDAVGLSIYSDAYNYYVSEKSSERHHQMLLAKLTEVVTDKNPAQKTKTYTYLHQIAEKMHRRSLVFLFTDMFQTEEEDIKLFEALQHLKYNKHEVVLFHLLDKEKEHFFNFDDAPKRFVDVETKQEIDLYAENVKEAYQKELTNYLSDIKLKCAQYKIKYVGVDIAKNFASVFNTYMVERQKF